MLRACAARLGQHLARQRHPRRARRCALLHPRRGRRRRHRPDNAARHRRGPARQWERHRRLPAPVTLGQPPRLVGDVIDNAVRAARTGQPADGAIVGHPASAGRATGPVRIVHGPDDFAAFTDGEVLVAERPPRRGRHCSPAPPPWSPTAAPSPRTPPSLPASTASPPSWAPARPPAGCTPGRSSPSTATPAPSPPLDSLDRRCSTVTSGRRHLRPADPRRRAVFIAAARRAHRGRADRRDRRRDGRVRVQTRWPPSERRQRVPDRPWRSSSPRRR